MAHSTSDSPPRAYAWLWPLALAAVVIVLGLPTLDEPFGRDQGVYAAMADVIRDGGLPYVDAWDHKPPGIFYVYAGIFSALGRSMLAVRLFDIFFVLALMAAVYALAARAFDATVGKVAALLMVLVYFCDTHYDHRAEADSVMMLPLALSALCLLRAKPGRGRLAWLAGAGFMSAACIWLKVTAAITVLAFGVFFVVEDLLARRPWTRIAGATAVYLAGVAAAVLPVVLYAWKAGFLDAMIEIVVRFNSQYYAAQAHAAGGAVGMAKLILQTTGWWPYLIFPAVVAAVVALLRRGRDELVVLVFGAASIAAVLMQGKLWVYHWMAVFPAWAVMGAAAYVEAARRMSWRELSPVRDARNLLLALTMAALASYAVATWAQSAVDSIALHTGRMTLAQFYGGEVEPGGYRERFGRYGFGDFSYWADDEVAAYVRERTAPGDRIFVWGFEPLIYFLADRRPASRFLMDHPLHAPFASRQAWRRELLEDLRRDPPVYFIVASRDLYELEEEESTVQLQQFGPLAEFVRRNYSPEIVTIEDFTLMRRAAP